MLKSCFAAVAVQLGKFTRNHQNVHFNGTFMICELNPHKTVAKPKVKGADPGHKGPSSCYSWFIATVKSLSEEHQRGELQTIRSCETSVLLPGSEKLLAFAQKCLTIVPLHPTGLWHQAAEIPFYRTALFCKEQLYAGISYPK